MRIFQHIFVLTAALVASNVFATPCLNNSCASCALYEPSRANLKIGGTTGCVPCIDPCGFNPSPQKTGSTISKKAVAAAAPGDHSASGQRTEILDPNEEILFASFDNKAIGEIGLVNPEAAYMMEIMNFLSNEPDNSLPARAERYATVLTSKAAVDAVLSLGLTNAHVQNYETAVGGTVGDRSVLSWALVKKKEKASIRFKHRIQSKAGDEVQTLYPDIEVQLAWQKTGTAGYWKSRSWVQKASE